MPSSAPDAPDPDDPNDRMRVSPDRLRAFADRLDVDGDAEMARHVRLAADELVAARRSAVPASGPDERTP